MLRATCRILSNILLSRVVPYLDEIIEDNQCRFQRNRSSTDQILCTCQIPKKNGSTRGQCISWTSGELVTQSGEKCFTTFSLNLANQ